MKAGEGDDKGWDGWMASLLDGHEFEQALGVGDGQESQACCSPWGRKESDTTEWLNWFKQGCLDNIKSEMPLWVNEISESF